MLKVRNWIGVVSAPILLASVGCAISHRPYASGNGMLPPERLMSMARTFERQGHMAQAKSAYQQVVAARPDFPNAKTNLDTLIANEMRGKGSGRPAGNGSPAQAWGSQSMLASNRPATDAPPFCGPRLLRQGCRFRR